MRRRLHPSNGHRENDRPRAHVRLSAADTSYDTSFEKGPLLKKADSLAEEQVVSNILASDLRAHLQATLTTRCEELRASLVGVATDPFALLDSIVGPAEHVIRRIPP